MKSADYLYCHFVVVVPQYWMISKGGEIRRDDACLDYAGANVTLYPCHGSKGNQYWTYDPEVISARFRPNHETLPDQTLTTGNFADKSYNYNVIGLHVSVSIANRS